MFLTTPKAYYEPWELNVIQNTIGCEANLPLTKPMILRNSMLEKKVTGLVQIKGSDGVPFVTLTIERQNELRISISYTEKKPITLELCEGYAEIFGDELPRGVKYTFPPGTTFGLFTWQGCTVKVYGTLPETIYIGKVVPYVVYMNIHCAIETLRTKAINQKTLGANLLIIGSPNSGKASLAKILVNYAIRINRRPTYVDLNVSSNLIALPGTLSTVTPDKKYSCQEGFAEDSQSTTFHFGHTSPFKNIELYCKVVSKMAKFVKYRIEGSRHDVIYSSGSVVRAHGWKNKYGMKMVDHIIKEFKITHILVINQCLLFSNLKSAYGNHLTVTPLDKGCAILPQDDTLKMYRRLMNEQMYFYGSRYPRFPETFEISFDKLSIFSVTVGIEVLSESSSPTSSDHAEQFEYKLTRLDLGTHLIHRIYSLPSVSNTPQSMASSFVYGFVAVTNINLERRTLTLLSPQPYPLPTNNLLITDVCYLDQ